MADARWPWGLSHRLSRNIATPDCSPLATPASAARAGQSRAMEPPSSPPPTRAGYLGSSLKAQADLDAPTAFFVLAWDAFRAPVFSYDEALRLARAVGVDLEREVVNRLAEKKGSNLRLWDSSQRAAKGALRSADGSRGMIHPIQHAAHAARKHNAGVARDLLANTRVDQDPRFFAALEAVLEVLPGSSHFSGVTLEGDLAASGDDFEALDNLYRLAFSDKMDEPGQLRLWRATDLRHAPQAYLATGEFLRNPVRQGPRPPCLPEACRCPQDPRE